MSSEVEYYYIQVPRGRREVVLPVEFLSVAQLLRDEPACRAIWDLITANFRTRSKFLSIWPCVRHAAVHRRHGRLAGFLLVSTAVNWQIDYVTVAPEARGQGVAEALVLETMNRAWEQKIPYVMLTSKESLRSLYEGRCGFQVVAATRPETTA
jgi:ribosomal protein S18 acetylase RimI-like enzyme